MERVQYGGFAIAAWVLGWVLYCICLIDCCFVRGFVRLVALLDIVDLWRVLDLVRGLGCEGGGREGFLF